MNFWVVCQTEPNREAWAAANVQRQGFAYYLPRHKELVGAHYRVRILFPSYLFVMTDGRWTFLTGTFGVTRIVHGTGGQPAQLDPAVIKALRASEDKDGFVVLPHRGASHFVKGQRVRVTDGIFLGSMGIYEGTTARDRERILIDYMGRKTRVEIEGELLEGV